MFSCDGMLVTETTHRVDSASSACAGLHQAKTWSSKALSLSTKLQFLQTIVMTWCCMVVKPGSYLKSISTSCLFFHMHCLRRICGISLLDHITTSGILKQCKTFPVVIPSLEARGLGGWYICIMADSRLPKLLMHGQVVGQTVVAGMSGRPRNNVILSSTSWK